MRSPENKQSSWIGRSVERREDNRLLLGRGRFTDDLMLPRMAYVAILPSPHAHARIKSIDTSRAKKLPGVLAVLSGQEVASVTGPMPTLSHPPVVQYCVAIDRVRHVGEPVAIVAAISRYIAEDALAYIDVEYEVLPAVVDPEVSVTAKGDSLLHPEHGSNVVHRSHHKWGPVEQAFREAAIIVQRRIRWSRVGPQPMETCSAVVDFDPSEGRFTIYSNMSQQSGLGMRLAPSLKVEPHLLTFHMRDVGGSFGGKSTLIHSTMIAAVMSRHLRRPVKYTEDRAEHMSNGNQHASDRIYDAALAINADGHFIGLRLRCLDDYGAYFLMGIGAHGNALAQAVGPYTIEALEYDLTCVVTNKTNQAPYRGFGGEVGNFVLERLVDATVSELGADPVELRKKNFIPNDAFPYRIPNGNIYDSGNYHRVLARALELADIPHWQGLKQNACAQGKRIGIGIATVNERSVLSVTELWLLYDNPPFPQTSSPESVQIKMIADGSVIVTLYAPHWGNSPETVAIQLVAEHLTVDPIRISINYASTDLGLISKGPVGSRYTVMLAGAIGGACRQLIERLKMFAAHMLSVPEDALAIDNERIFVSTDPAQGRTFAEVSRAAHNFRLDFPKDDKYRSGLVTQYTYDHPLTTKPKDDRSDLGIFYPIVGHACHIAVIEIDDATNKIRFLKYVAVHDAGTVLNPKLIDGQIRGGIAQGIGTALYEKYVYDDNGQLLTGSLADYAVPTSQEIPDFVIDHIETPSPYTEFGMKGCGEGGRLAATPAIASAIDDALRDEGVYIDELPVTPSVLHARRMQLIQTEKKL